MTGNTDLGAMPNTFSQGAFTFDSPHDTTFESNIVYQSAASGYLFRLVNYAEGGGGQAALDRGQ